MPANNEINDLLLEQVREEFTLMVKENGGGKLEVVEHAEPPSAYHQGERELTFDWEGTDGIWRNVQSWFPEEREELVVFIHAWIDFMEGADYVRHSHSKIVANVSIPVVSEKLHDILGIAYRAVTLWDLDDLTDRTVLDPSTKPRKVNLS